MTQPALSQTNEKQKLEDLQRQTEAETAKAAEIDKSRQSVVSEIAELQSELVKLGAEISQLQSRENQLKTQLTDLQDQASDISQRIFSDRQSLSKILAGLQRVEVNPPPALAVSPQDAAQSVRAAKLMASLNTQLKQRVDDLKNDLSELGKIEAEIETEQLSIADLQGKLAIKQDQIKDNISKKAALESELSAEFNSSQDRANKLARDADTLRELIRKLEARAQSVAPRVKPGGTGSLDALSIIPRIKPGKNDVAPLPDLPPDTLRFADARGRLQAPTNGRVSKTYSASHQGYTVVTSSEAQITAPYTSRVEFAGDFKNYDKVVIMNMGDGYFMLMTGLGEILTQTGSYVSTGEPVGLMPFNAQNQSELYIEIRKDGSPVNPKPWLGTAFARQG